MNSIQAIFASPAWNRLVETLLHSIWQGAALALLLWVCLRFLPGRHPHGRYRAALGIQLGLVLLLAATWLALSPERQGAPGGTGPNVAANLTPDTLPAMPSEWSSSSSRLSDPVPGAASGFELENGSLWVPWLASAWLAGLSLMLLRLGTQLFHIRAIHQRSKPVEDPELLQMLEELQALMRLGRRVGVRVLNTVASPSVYGVLQPTLLLPATFLTGLSPSQIRAILAHELAHVRRWDYLINLGQSLLEAVLFFNPAVWWINRQIRVEREACCDAWAVRITGEERLFAEALTFWAGRGALGSEQPELAPAMANPESPGSTLERLKRILFPEYRPVRRLPWSSVAGMLLVSSLLLAAAWRGSEVVVALATEILSPRERIERIAELQKEHLPFPAIIETPGETLTVSGRVITESGRPLPNPALLQVQIRSGTSHHSYFKGTDADGRFSQEGKPGLVYVGAKADGYAPAWIGPISPGGEQDLETLELVLRPGFTGRVRLVNPEGKPLSGVELTGNYMHPAWDSHFPIATNKTEPDSSGLAELEDAREHPLHVRAALAGYQYTEWTEVVLRPDEIITLTMHPAEPAVGTVVAAETGQPVAGAALKLIGREGRYMTGSDPTYARVMATTDPEGKFMLDSLPEASRHTFWVEAPGFAPIYLRQVSAGQRELKVELKPELSLGGKILGDLNTLTRWQGKPVVSISASIEVKAKQTIGYQIRVPVEERDGVGWFEARGLWEDMFSVHAGSRTVRLSLTRSVEDLVLDLSSDETAAVAEREVVVRFKPPQEAPAPRGTIRVLKEGGGRSETRPVENGELRFTIPEGTRVHFEPEGLTGYWFEARSGLPIPAGEGAHLIEIPVIPSGAVFGEVTAADGSPLDRVMISVLEVEKSPWRGPGFLGVKGKDQARPGDGPTRFVAQPLPLGGKYRIVAHRHRSYVVSELIELTETNAIEEMHLRLPEGITLTGKVEDQQGRPLRGVEANLKFIPVGGHEYGMGDGVYTDATGAFHMEGVNPHALGEQRIEVRNVPGFRPLIQPVNFEKLPLTLRLEPGLVVTGRVIDEATGRPIPGVEVYALPAKSDPPEPTGWLAAESKTDARGMFRFSNFAQRSYQLNAREARLAGSRQNAMVNPGQKEEAILRVELFPGSELQPSPAHD
jgi:beta-lactamase regulating signal transducer with metallopeptidase domain